MFKLAATFLARLAAIAVLLWAAHVVTAWWEIRSEVAACEAGPYAGVVVEPGQPAPYEATFGEGAAPVTVTTTTVYCVGEREVFPAN